MMVLCCQVVDADCDSRNQGRWAVVEIAKEDDDDELECTTSGGFGSNLYGLYGGFGIVWLIWDEPVLVLMEMVV